MPVAEGPPAPPAPTLVRFERNVVALHGRIDRQPNQLNCDTLRLTLIPGAPPPARRDKDKADDPARPSPRPTARTARSGRVAADPPTVAIAATDVQGSRDGRRSQGRTGCRSARGPSEAPASPPDQGLFGNLTLQKAHATGHAVWLQLRQQGSKVRCNEMIHDRRMPYRPDSTAFRGDKTRPIWLEKIDYEPEESGEDGARTRTATASPGPTGRRIPPGRSARSRTW